MKHVFLTGEKQVGKSELLRRVAQPWAQDGFVTYLQSEGPARTVWISPAAGGESRCVAAITPLGKTVYSEIFETFGARLAACSGKEGMLTVMDELGYLEADAPLFQQAVLSRIARKPPLIGVLRDMDTPFLNTVRIHPNVQLVTVTKENREDLFLRLQNLYGSIK